jgi:hypothetical protein
MLNGGISPLELNEKGMKKVPTNLGIKNPRDDDY